MPHDYSKTETRHSGDGAIETKKTYKAPALQIYGTVAEFTKGSQTAGTDGGNSTQQQISSVSYKENVVLVGTHPMGFGIYLYDYRSEYRDAFGHGRQFGVLAEEVAKIVPEAVGQNADGFTVVDYARLGITRH